MVDIETMDTEPTAAILSIGAVAFDKRQTSSPESLREGAFYARISIQSNEQFDEK